MAKEISPLGWVLIILVVALTISLYISLFSKLKGKSPKTGWINTMQNAGKTLKDPFRHENARMEELAKDVEKLQQYQIKVNSTGNEQEKKSEQ
jgi:uncharacterized membrane protein (DUF106 family)